MNGNVGHVRTCQGRQRTKIRRPGNQFKALLEKETYTEALSRSGLIK